MAAGGDGDVSIGTRTKIQLGAVIAIVIGFASLIKMLNDVGDRWSDRAETFETRLANHALTIERSFGDLRAEVREVNANIRALTKQADGYATKDQLRALEDRVEKLEKKGP